MIKSNELRIGNFVKRTNKLTKEELIIELAASCILDISSNGEMSSFNYEAITLNDEFILKLGFEKKSYFTTGIKVEVIYYQLNNFVIFILHNSFEVELINKSGDQFNLYKNFKKEVHILQNIYFLLRNKELTLKQ